MRGQTHNSEQTQVFIVRNTMAVLQIGAVLANQVKVGTNTRIPTKLL